jgi:MoxR-like ATPase
MLARALAASVDATVRRIQFTPDLLPGDVTGVSVYNPVDREFEFKPGAIFAQIVIADEINRLPQDAVGAARGDGAPGHRRRHCTRWPSRSSSSRRRTRSRWRHLRPAEAQRDRFMMRISMGYPDAERSLMLRQRDA